MSALTSLLARDHALPVRKIEEALSRQVTSGGDIGTALLELDALSENALAAYQAALHGLLPATREEVMRVQRDLVRLVPREVAEKHRLVPLAVDGRALLVAMASPLVHDVEAQLGFLLGYDLVVRVVCEARISAALAHHYGVDPTARHKRLIEHLRHRDAGAVPYVAPLEHGKLGLAQRALVSKKISASAWLDEPDEPESLPPPPPPPARASTPSVAPGRATDPMGVPRSQIDSTLLESESRPPESSGEALAAPRHALPPGPATSLSELALADAIDASEPAIPLEAALPRTEARATSPYGFGSETAAQSPRGAEPSGETAASEPPWTARGERLSVAPILGVGVRSMSPRGPRPGPRVRPIAEPVLDSEPPEPQRPEPVSMAARAPSRGRSSLVPEPSARVSAAGPGPELVGRRGPRLRGPLTSPQATKLLEEAGDRDAILAVFFAFARQFFDYSALFALVEDRAEGRDAFGEGTLGAQVRALSLTVTAHESSLLSVVRASGQPCIGRLETPADLDLATALRRPREITALAYPVVIRQRSVLVLYGDRSGEDFALGDLPELAAFVPRVADALEQLILRRKREVAKDHFERPEARERETLKSAASALRRSSPPAPRPSERVRREDVWSSSKLEAVRSVAGDASAEPTLADALAKAELPGGISGPTPSEGLSGAEDLAALALSEARGEPEPRSTLVDPSVGPFRPTEELTRSPDDETPSDPVRRPLRTRATTRDVLGIPRAAPPPPFVPDIFEPSPESDLADADALGGTEDLVTDDLVARGPRTIPAPPPSVDGDGSTETLGGAAGAEPHAEGPEASTGYLLKNAGADVVPPSRGSSSRPPRRSGPPASQPAGPGGRHDPRREDDSPIAPERVSQRPSAPQRLKPAPRHAEMAKPTHDREVPSVIVDMGEGTHALVEDLMRAGPEGETPTIDALLEVGEVALPALAQAFPGPLWFDRRQSHRKLPRGRDVSAVSRALVAFRERAAPYVGALAGNGSADRRFYAVLVASEIASGALVDPLVQRLFDEDAGVRSLALEVLPKFHAFAEMQDQLIFLRRTARVRGKDPARRLQALAGLAALRDVGALRNLADLLSDESEPVRRAAHTALVAITCEDLGESTRRWSAWLEKNEGRNRIEWLIDALLSSEESLRAQAGEELKAITQQYFGYHPAAARKEREVVQTKYRNWWEREGKSLFR
jgi:hypothetical protein